MLDIYICTEDECNDMYGQIHMYQALQLKQPIGVHIPSEQTVYRVMDIIGISPKTASIQQFWGWQWIQI